jgi:two-component system NtrC family sensor kinase
VDLRQVDQDLAGIRTRSIGLLLAQVLLISLLIFFLTRRFVQLPILKLIDGTKAVSALDLDRSIEIHSPRELQALANSFNDMRERLKKALDENAKFTHNLESMVEERTRQLQLAEQKLIRSDRLASLGQLAATVAHEINNPVAGLLNLGTLMQRVVKADGLPPERVEEFRSYLDLVVTETSRVGRIVSDLLAFSRQAPPHRGEVALNNIVRNAVSVLSHKLELSNTGISLDLQEDLPTVLADGSQLQQVFVNLLFNASEAMPDGGTVHVSTRGLHDRKAVVLAVSDTGTGIHQENLSRIFDPFFTTKEEGKGVGLGLAVVYGIVRSHGGDIEVDSQVDRGTSFRVTLPLEGYEAGAAAKTEARA